LNKLPENRVTQQTWEKHYGNENQLSAKTTKLQPK
tara:strand:- start:200 stop:304 length:105 start_codon:yes stop_codon:yes gene_type:complete